MELMANFAALFIESAPFLLAGMLIAGVIHQLVPKKWIESTLGKRNSVVTAAFIGAPLPLCSCSVIPVAMGIRRSGASKASTASFLVSTPETGVDSIGVTYALMGPVMTIARPIAAIVSAIIAGSLIAVFGSADRPLDEAADEPIKKSCCHKGATQPVSTLAKLKAAFVFGYGKLLRDFMVWFLIGIFFAALVTTFVPEGFLTQYGQGVFAMLVIVLISVPMYICATASTPLAVGLLLSGITPGAALVFMLTGPATNIATLIVIKNELGTRELVIYLIAIVISAVSAGLLLDYLFETFQWKMQLAHGDHSDMMGLLYQASAVILAGLITFQLQKRYLNIKA
ncbi:SO_0444 family Cu/Zn efflux transporter [Marinomonas sp. 2405UD68-3]|uniref:SO_0444 family Cu/Zn efflux transporter n=1 Tax=Marinomonas sp. 2405UD68-3 TaxID=3391835 RepID=UPI0039C9B8FF